MTIYLTGSRALKYWLPEFPLKEDADWDLIVSPGSHLNDPALISSRLSRYDVKDYTHLNDRGISYYYSDATNSTKLPCGEHAFVMTLPGLALMKRSHLWSTKNWDKHIAMYHKWLKHYLPVDEVGQSLLKERISLTKKEYPQRAPKLNKTNGDFFDDKVVKKFDHDWIHELVAYYDRPLFERLKRPDNFDKAWCERGLWEAFSTEDKIRCVAEESHVIACERYMIPNDWDYNPRKAYYQAVRKVCTTLCSGWFRDAALTYFPEVLESFSMKKFNRVKEMTT